MELKLLPASFAERCVPKSAIKSSLKLLVDDYLMSGDAEGAVRACAARPPGRLGRLL